MTLLNPTRMWLLAAPVLLLIGYLLAQRVRQRAVVRFTDVDLLSSIAPKASGWQRHVASALLLGALVLLVVGFARPAAATRVPKKSATIILALDTSASMAAQDVSPTRLTAAKNEAEAFVRGLPSGLKVGVVSFDTTARVTVAATADRAAVLSGIAALKAGAGTATADAIDLALVTIRALPKAANGKPEPAAVVLMSDGAPSIGRNGLSPRVAADIQATAAKQQGVPIDTIAFGTSQGVVMLQGQEVSVPSDPATMARIAHESGGKSFTAKSANQLRSVYNQIGRAVGYVVHKHEVTVWFTGFGLMLGALAAAAALIWSQRLV
ncbi:MAG TPA: VWA domain-containing protein [Mycobacteriales bacterium]|nr:VWA domain-containing protein [Mycobacteriales bacterium]